MITSNLMENICQYGTYYNPATKHYGGAANNVVCDKCHRNNLSVCVGWQTFDLCLKCVQDITDNKSNIVFDTTHERAYGGIHTAQAVMVTNMMQSQFRK